MIAHFVGNLNADLTACFFFIIGHQLQKWQAKRKNWTDFPCYFGFMKAVTASAMITQNFRNLEILSFKGSSSFKNIYRPLVGHFRVKLWAPCKRLCATLYMLAQESEKSSGKVPQEKHVLNLFLASTLKVKGPFSLGCSTGV